MEYSISLNSNLFKFEKFDYYDLKGQFIKVKNLLHLNSSFINLHVILYFGSNYFIILEAC